MASWMRQTGCARSTSFPMGGELPRQRMLTDAEAEEYDRLAGWFCAWLPPAAPYSLGPHVTVHDTARSHAYRCARIREGLFGQRQRAMLVWLRAHWQIFGGQS